LALLADW